MENIYQAFFSFVGSPNSAVITPLMCVTQFRSYTSQLLRSAVGWVFLVINWVLSYGTWIF